MKLATRLGAMDWLEDNFALNAYLGRFVSHFNSLDCTGIDFNPF
jgi:hypothetical protein